MPYCHFTQEDRDLLQTMIAFKLRTSAIARILGKDPSSINREVQRNSTYGVYLGNFASQMALARRRLAKSSPKRSNDVLMARVEALLKEKASPEQIAGRIAMEHAKDPAWRISYETIYRYIYEQKQKRPDLVSYLRQSHKKRRKRSTGKARRGIIPGRVSIDERPKIADKKLRLGDWEGDTIEGKGKQGYIATFTDRKSKFLIAFKLQNKKAESFARRTVCAFSKIPSHLVQTLTLDNGKENARHMWITEMLGANVYFAHAYHSWERGLNEHTNGLLRQYFPKRLPLNLVHHRTLDKVVNELNNRPRKCLGYRTPHEVFFGLPIALQI